MATSYDLQPLISPQAAYPESTQSSVPPQYSSDSLAEVPIYNPGIESEMIVTKIPTPTEPRHSLADLPIPLKCLNCHIQVTTNVKRETDRCPRVSPFMLIRGNIVILTCMFLCCCSRYLCCPIYRHTCPNCKILIGRGRRANRA